jgi:hypothetical protein
MALKEIELKVPTSYSDIPLRKWLELQKQMINYEGDEEAVTALMLYHLCGLDPKYLKNIAIDDYIQIKTELSSFISNVELPLQRFIWIDGVEYGFEPNLSNMTYGSFADITKYNEIKIDDNWASIMSILYRPVTKKQGDMYTIEPYSGNLKPEKFLDVSMDIHFGCLFFFVRLSKDLLNFTLKSMMGMELPLNIKSILGKNGEHIQQLLNLQEETYSKLMK